MKEQKAEVNRARPVYHSDDFKRKIIEEYLSSGLSKSQIQLKYGLKRHSTIHAWMKALGYSDTAEKVIKLESTNHPALAKQSTLKSASILELETKIRLLEKQLEDERLRSEMYNRMIDMAEKTYKIPVRKNSNTK
jgi:transposase